MALDSDLFMEQVFRCDSKVEALLRGHLWVEHVLEMMLRDALHHPDALDLDRIGWRQKLALCHALGALSEDEVAALAEVNRLRNRLAHDLSGAPTRADVNRLLARAPAPVDAAMKILRENDEADPDEDATLIDLRRWFFATLMYLDWRHESQAWERENRAGLVGAAAVVLLGEQQGKVASQEDAERRAGLPPRPTPGASWGVDPERFRASKPAAAED